ncbi:hypothetical protein NMY22_g15600 [Coprinellus aureogranulatus]|nr:hypothetical protein NMY22_g15600 [Coprinellus aureogranulatus]
MGRAAKYFTREERLAARRARRAERTQDPRFLEMRANENRRHYAKKRLSENAQITVPERVQELGTQPFRFKDESVVVRFRMCFNIELLENCGINDDILDEFSIRPPFPSSLLSPLDVDKDWDALSAALHGYHLRKFVEAEHERLRQLRSQTKVSISSGLVRHFNHLHELWDDHNKAAVRYEKKGNTVGKYLCEYNAHWTATKMIERLRPYVEAKKPGEKDDPETQAFEKKIMLEAEDLKLESFGVELLHTIGSVYMMKASSFLKSKKFLGIPGFFAGLKEKGAYAKDLWGVIGSALDVRKVMVAMEKAQIRGDVPEEELRALEMDVTGKILLASWRGARLEVITVLREVCDNVLREPGQPDQVLYNRAKGMLLIGAIFKSTTPDESDAERRELERMVAEAAKPKKKEKGSKFKVPGNHVKHDETTKAADAPAAAAEPAAATSG